MTVYLLTYSDAYYTRRAIFSSVRRAKLAARRSKLKAQKPAKYPLGLWKRYGKGWKATVIGLAGPTWLITPFDIDRAEGLLY